MPFKGCARDSWVQLDEMIAATMMWNVPHSQAPDLADTNMPLQSTHLHQESIQQAPTDPMPLRAHHNCQLSVSSGVKKLKIIHCSPIPASSRRR